MASVFESVAKSVVRELDPKGGLIPVDSLWSSSSFRPYCLLARKLSSSWFWKPRYQCLNLSIRDILEPDAPEPDVERDIPFHIKDCVDGELQVKVELKALGQGKLAGGAAASASARASVSALRLRVPPRAWEAMSKERRLRRPEHKILQQVQRCGRDLFVVTEVLQTQEDLEATRACKQEGSGQFSLPGALRMLGQGQGHLNQEKTVTIPSGSTLAFQAALLVIGPDWEIYHIPSKNQRTFPLPKKDRKPASGLLSHISLSYFKMRLPSASADIVSDGDIEDQMPVTEDFQGLQVEAKVHADGLKDLSRELCGQMLAGLGQALREEQALEALEEALEQGLCCGGPVPPDAPGGAILECLVSSSGEVEEELARPILYLVQALTGLSETQRVLLAEALETGDLSRQLQLVHSVLEQSSPWQERRAVSLPQELLGGSWDSEAPAWVLLEECHLELQEDVPQVSWRPEAQGRTCALYSCLALLVPL
ncbi:gasdermin-D, partial [Suricata suricatta]|uniref:Gasdermin D n=1 Tax=Suricata suricatta TaxID=37032 RepID=A0A673UPV8_SURSU